MPPRVRLPSTSASNRLLASSLPSFATCDRRTPRCAARHFSQTLRNDTRLRKDFYRWLDGPGAVFKKPLPGSTNYLSAYDENGKLLRVKRENRKDEEAAEALAQGDTEGVDGEDAAGKGIQKKKGIPKETPGDLKPYPQNPLFSSQPVLSEELRELIYQRVTVDGKSVTRVSADLRVSLERVAAVVRLKTIEKQWETDGKPLAKPYSKAVLAMLPTTPAPSPNPGEKRIDHEPITDIPIVSSTGRQTFHPTSESEHFTRRDAAAVFDPKLRPVDDRMPHPELVLAAKLRDQGLPSFDITERVSAFVREQDEGRRARKERKEEFERRNTVVHEGRRWDFKIRSVNVDDVGRDGRSLKGTGWRYGVPHQDRKRAQVKIPTEVRV